MKKLILLVCLISVSLITFAQEESKTYGPVPSITVKTLDGETFDMGEISNDGKPIIITFWATWCKPCIKEHDAINEVYEDWVDETGVKLYAVSIDNARSSRGVLPLVNGKNWEFEILLDENGDFKRAMNVNVPPHTFIINGNGEIVWQHVGYLEGDEAEYIEIVEKLIEGKPLE
ncbi:MAG TPA: TlpA disulfide reductase family protein [Bacteroidales bacterium]|nr:TlpA family protein disulfide reductase [Bacteroidales bacterium]HPE54908.1 TlpA disulfide reductase family protein [Bacteroidales bacterium]HRX97065.1 TlpA disulfide reductase family protein [Bacteroidales bacterium]